MRKFLAIFFAFAILEFSTSSSAFAEDNNQITADYLAKVPITQITNSNFEQMKTTINFMSDKEFDDFITKYIKEEGDQDRAKEKLAKVGVNVDFPKENQNIGLQSIDEGDFTFTVYSAHRGTDSYTRLYCSFDTIETETRPATYDVLGIFFDKNKADFYATNYSDSKYCNNKDQSQFLNGTILFNVYDNKLTWLTDTQYVAVYVTPKSTGNFVYGYKYTHTYNTTSTSTSGSASVNFSGSGVSGSIGFSVVISSKEASWDLSDSNIIFW
jgi:hypothetical protein